MLGLALKNAGLTIITLTLYRFWARTSMRRRLVVARLGDGRSARIHRQRWRTLPRLPDRAAVLLPAGDFRLLHRALGDGAGHGPLGSRFGFYVISVPLVAAARYWMRRYQLSRTRWRGIRLGLAGSAWSFAAASWGWWVLQVLSLGWYTPAARMNRARLMWENTRFGDQPFEFVERRRVAAERPVVAVRARLVFVSDRVVFLVYGARRSDRQHGTFRRLPAGRDLRNQIKPK